MSIPKRNRSETIAGTGWTYYLRPHVKVGVDTNNSSVTSNLIDKILDVSFSVTNNSDYNDPLIASTSDL